MMFPFKTYVQSVPIVLEIGDGMIESIEGGFEAKYLGQHLDAYNDRNAFAVSQPKAKWGGLGMRDKFVVESCRCEVIRIASKPKDLRGTEGGVFVAGHSAGGHLATMIAATDWAWRGFGAKPVQGFCSVSGIYELELVSRSAKRSCDQ